MKHLSNLSIITIFVFLTGCSTVAERPAEIPHYESPPRVAYGFALPVDYGDNKHPGLDYRLRLGTPIIASASGKVTWKGIPCPNSPSCGGEFIYIESSENQAQLYGHLLETFVGEGQAVERGHLIGLSGQSNNGNPHLHFGVCIVGEETNCQYHKYSRNPRDFWINGKAECFDESVDYSSFGDNEMTHPVACGVYGAKLKAELEG